jgi:hypothetical protein
MLHPKKHLWPHILCFKNLLSRSQEILQLAQLHVSVVKLHFILAFCTLDHSHPNLHSAQSSVQQRGKEMHTS